MIQLWIRNMAIAIGVIVGFFSFGFALLFLNTYFGSAMVSVLFVAIIGFAWMCFMCYKIAQDQFDREKRRSEQVMDRLKREYPQ